MTVLLHAFDIAVALCVLLVAAGVGLSVLSRLGIPVRPRVESFPLAAGIGLGVMAYGVFALGMLGWLYPPTLALLITALAISAGKQFRILYEAIRDLPAQWRRWDAHCLWLGAGVALVSGCALVLALAPPGASDWDSLQYHLAVPKIYLRQHGIHYIGFTSHSNFPFTMEMLYLVGLAFRGPECAKLFHWMTGLLTGVTLFAIGRRYVDSWVGAVACFIFLTTPAVVSELGMAYIDVGLTFFALLTMLALLRWWIDRDPRYAPVAGLLAGWVMGCKYLGTITVGFLFLGGLFCCLCRSGIDWKKVVLATGLAGAIGSPWYVRNWIWTGNPVYPFAYEVFGGRNWSPKLAEKYRTEQLTYGTGRGLRDLVQVPWNLAWWPFNADPARGLRYEVQPWPTSAIGPAYLAFTVAALSFGVGSPPLTLITAAALFHGLTWFALMQYIRYLFPVLALLSVVCGYAAWRLCQYGGIPAMVTRGALAVSFLFTAYLTGQLAANCAGVVFGWESRDAYLARSLETYPMLQYINKNLPRDARLITYGEPRGFYLDRDYLWGEPDHHRLIDYENCASPEDLIERYQRLGITHILINQVYFNISEPPGGLQRLVREGIDRELFPVLHVAGPALLLGIASR